MARLEERLVHFRPRTVLVVLGIIFAAIVMIEVVQAARGILIWIGVALFLALALNPAVEWLMARGVPRRAFGHFGFGGSGAWAEANRGLAMALIVNTGMGTPFGDLRGVRIGGAVLASADARSPKQPVSMPMQKESRVRSKRGKTAGQRRKPRPAVLSARTAKRGAV